MIPPLRWINFPRKTWVNFDYKSITERRTRQRQTKKLRHLKSWAQRDGQKAVLYIGAKVLGLECSYYKTGNVKDATFRGDSISNCEARRLMYAKTYIDIATGTLHSDNDKLKAAAAELLASVE